VKKPTERGKVPEPKPVRRRPSAVSRVFIWFFVLLLTSGIMAGATAFYAFKKYTAPGPLAEDKVYIIDKGLGTPDIAVALQDAGIISSAQVFSAMAQVTGTRTRLKAGEYAFKAGSSMRDVMALIASGKSITYKLSVPEGWTSDMAVARVNANEILEGPAAIAPAEGSIMPDTYVFRRGMTRQKLVEDMQAAQEKLIDSLWDARSPLLPIETKEEALTLASIVEKETGVAKERPLIASVFMNRLKKGMRLQSDPTIIYGITGGKGKLDRRLTRADIKTDTPYNTYRIKGLPPGPIANPGRAALEAVLNPEPTNYLYFVADGSGGHAFAATLEEHNANVKRWRQIAGNAAAAVAVDDETALAGDAPEAGAGDAAQPAAVEVDASPATASTTQQAPPPASPPPELVNPPASPAPSPTPEAGAASGDDAVPPVVPRKVLETAIAPETAPGGGQQQASAGPPVPQAKPGRAVSTAAHKPGSVITVDGDLVAIPKPNPKR
jgi:UPF0755 protein